MYKGQFALGPLSVHKCPYTNTFMVYLTIIFIPTLYLYTLLWRLRKEISGKEALTLSQYKPKFLPLIKCPNLIIKLHLNYKKHVFGDMKQVISLNVHNRWL